MSGELGLGCCVYILVCLFVDALANLSGKAGRSYSGNSRCRCASVVEVGYDRFCF